MDAQPGDGRYEFSFAEGSVYARVRDVLLASARPGRVVDLGCGFGALAEPATAAGLDYVGVDLDPVGLDSLAERGFATRRHDLTDLAGLERLLDELAGEQGLSAVLALDVVEHLPEPEPVLRLLREVAGRAGEPVLVVSIPNVTHQDIAAKLLTGRWDVTPTGLLDGTHLQHFSGRRLDEMLRSTGWHEVRRADYALQTSDQHFPADLPALVPGTPLADLLRAVRAAGDPYGSVNQFVRACAPGDPEIVVPVREAAEPTGEAPFLSVLVRTTGSRPEKLRDLLLCLSAQTDEDFELLLLAHGVEGPGLAGLEEQVEQLTEGLRARTRLVPLPPGGGRSRPLNAGVEQARGQWLCAVDDDDVVLSSYVTEFHRLARTAPGRVLRTVVVEQDMHEDRWPDRVGHAAGGPFRYAYPPGYDPVDSLRDNSTPFCGLALPAALFRDLGVRFDESLPVLEDWDVQLRAVQLCGIATSPLPTSVYHRWRRGAASSSTLHAEQEWAESRERVAAQLDARPLLLPAGTVARVRTAPVPTPLLEVELRTEIDLRGAEMERLAYEAHYHAERAAAAAQAAAEAAEREQAVRAELEAFRTAVAQRRSTRVVQAVRRVDPRGRRPRA